MLLKRICFFFFSNWCVNGLTTSCPHCCQLQSRTSWLWDGKLWSHCEKHKKSVKGFFNWKIFYNHHGNEKKEPCYILIIEGPFIWKTNIV